MKWTGTKEIKVFVGRWIDENLSWLRDKTIIDVPAGNGFSSRLLKNAGSQVLAFDLFPEFFKEKGIDCHYADLGERIPLADGSVDGVLCQEGIEHVSDQIKAFQEFNRVLKTGGRLIVTTPNYSNLRSRLSYFLTESEYFGKIPAPNEFDSLWFTGAQGAAAPKIYFGHVFLLGMQRLRLFAKISGFRISEVYPTRVNNTALLLFPFAYPFIVLFNLQAYFRMKRKHGPAAAGAAWEVFRLGVSPSLLLDSHLFVVLEKTSDLVSCQKSLYRETAAETFVT